MSLLEGEDELLLPYLQLLKDLAKELIHLGMKRAGTFPIDGKVFLPEYLIRRAILRQPKKSPSKTESELREALLRQRVKSLRRSTDQAADD
ncbi:MAG: hypothetical protein M4579_002834 [Chaenotheca gracillima]|nr:MAG: hypothetical protein M4579_002834 [Chaenotheca gracillima]